MADSGPSTRYRSSLQRTCNICSRSFNVKGFSRHQKACERAAREKEAQKLAERELKEFQAGQKRARQRAGSLEKKESKRQKSTIPDSSQLATISESVHSESDQDEIEGAPLVGDDISSASTVPPNNALNVPGTCDESVPPTSQDPAVDQPAEHTVQVDDIKIEYHPHSRQPTVIKPLDEYLEGGENEDLRPYLDPEPWKVFGTHDNFEFAEWALKAQLNEAQIKTILRIINRVRDGGSGLSIRSHKDLVDIWSIASESQEAFKKQIINVPYKGIERPFEVYTRSLLDYFLSLAHDPIVARKAAWHSTHVSQWNGTNWIPVYCEPVTGLRAWELESAIPEDGTPFFIEIYADKSVLSSFGTQQAYPVVARWCQLPHHTRNSNGLGAGRVIGMLPIIQKDAKEQGKTGYTIYKNVVWHESAGLMLREIAQASHTGHRTLCGDDILRILFFIILILCADYEEQCTMALLRGLKCLFPCVICDVPSGRMWDVTEPWGIRDPDKIKEILFNTNLNRTQKNEMTKNLGVRPTENIFWTFFNCNPHEALSFDRLHAFHGGLFGKHLFSMFQEVLESLGWDAQDQVDSQAKLVPRYSGLNHFSSISDVKFTDGSKYEDISKIIILVSHNILTEDQSREGFQLLKTMRAYQLLDNWLAFEFHTEETVQETEKAVARLEVEIKALAPFFPEKLWQFPKAHSYAHAPRDIRQKGVTRNYNTKLNEKLHRLLKDIYKHRTNFKNVNDQLTKIEHQWLVASTIRGHIEAYDEYKAEASKQNIEGTDGFHFAHIHLTSRQDPISLTTLEARYSGDAAFQGFRGRLEKYLTVLFQAFEIPLPHGRPIRLSREHRIVECQSMAVQHKSAVTRRQVVQRLHISERFYNNVRNDAVLIRSADGMQFPALLQMVFICSVDETDRPLAVALVHGLDAGIGGLVRRKDRALELIRLRARPRNQCEFVPIESIVRGILVIPAFDQEGDYMLADALDTDIRKRVHYGTGGLPKPPPL